MRNSGEDKKKRDIKGGLAWVLSYVRPYRHIFIPSLVALFVTAALSLAFPFFLKELIGDPADAWKDGSIDVLATRKKADETILWLVGILAVQAFIAYWRVRGFTRAGEAALNDLRRDLFQHLLKLPMPFFQDQRSGSLSNRISADLGVVRETVLNTLPQAARHSVVLVGSLIAIFVFSWKLSLVMLCSVPVVVLAVAISGRKVRKHSREAQDALAESGMVMEESVQGIADVKAFSNESFEKTRYDRALDRFFDVTLKGANARAAFLSFVIFAMFGTIGGVAWYGSHMLAGGGIDQKDFTGFILFSVFVGASLGTMPEIISQFQAMSGATERLRELMAERSERSGRLSAAKLGGALAFDNVSFRYPSRPDAPVLHELSFIAEPGKRIALVGPSGAGKSTVFSLILGFHEPESGRVLFDESNAADLELAAIRKQIAVVPQEVMLFGGSIRENIEYGRPGASAEDIEAAAKQANAHEFISKLPEGYDTLVGPRGVKLSGGQRQRIAIARAILADPRILLLDEATSALDTESERLVNEALERLMTGRTSLVIAHRLSTVRDADTILVLNHGKLVESGTHDQLIAKQGTYHLLAETQLL
ncbi:ABC transporter transmembrane domain-containing protein [Luteolibacter sp. GHJ8]|uniref:ABC transporter transmembrane domain-containing protein n=1 Tax=Luteolibacter rhizosphaerae TaxID=2989719 RepID=A0ABT3G8N5_9BACT|nr:ABC transporter transmembrane domain-containing protein [Luteolibacter rhizosphaerae]MCW1916195.1 ABC transporter transmembrane domain-containing protein [Luteolibacter rhizosphaerae]